MLAIAVLILEPRWLKPEWMLWGHKITWYLVTLMLVLTVVSGIDYFVHARQKLRGRPVGGVEEGGVPPAEG
jgi:phosphatidylglycerophosphate synthase